MPMFFTFLEQGFFHILDLNGLDHILFLMVLILNYSFENWKKIVWAITAFTIAHSITLILSVYDVIILDARVIEIGIALTIFYTAIENLFFPNMEKYRAVLAGIFGLIHGMGFSRLLKELFAGQEYNPFNTLLAFNIGIELAQLLFVILFLLIFQSIKNLTKSSLEFVKKIISIAIALQALYWVFTR